MNVIKVWWDLSDYLLLKYADGYCNMKSCSSKTYKNHLGYPKDWLVTQQEYINYPTKYKKIQNI